MPLTDSRIFAEYRLRTPTSAKLYAEACQVFPSGVTHDARLLQPYPLYVARAQGARKWDVDGNEYVDYSGGHGALLLGHNHPTVTQAVVAQAARGTHYGACHELELQWGKLVQQLIPSAERVRFTSSGTEATLLAMRVARAFTGRPKILRFLTNFHGWQDHVAFGVASHHDGTPTPGVLAEIAQNIVLCPPGDIAAVGRMLALHPDIAGIMLEPTGASWGQIPISADFLHELRELTIEHDSVLIFDEVISGFRCSPGGAQAAYGITPDLTTLAKILAGGLPGGALVGRRDIMDWLDYAASLAAGREKISHHGTFNANPLSAAAGVATLSLISSTPACQQANDYAATLREGLNQILAEEQVPWVVYGTFSGFHIYTNPHRESVTPEQIESGNYDYLKLKQATQNTPLLSKLRIAMLIHGVELFGWPGGPTSSVHGPAELDQTLNAFRRSLQLLKDDGDIAC